MTAAPAMSALPSRPALPDMRPSPDLPGLPIHPVALVAISLTGALIWIGAFKAMGWLLTFMTRIFA
jgi:hypothetical protein